MALKSQYTVAVVNETNLADTGASFTAGATQSAVFNCGGTCATGFITPSSWTTANVSFLVSKTPNGTFVPLTNFDGTAFGISSVAANQWVPLQPAQFNAVLYLKVVSSAAQSSAPVVDMCLSPIFQGLHN